MVTHRLARPILAAVIALVASLLVATPASAVDDPSAPVFINELHYDNTGTDVGEFVEVAGPAGTDLTGWSIVLYNGSNGEAYDTIDPTDTIPDQDDGFGTVSFTLPTNGLQNGSPDGLALVDPGGVVIEFLSYEGTFAATDGPAAGLTSTDLGQEESSATPAGFSLQRNGTGSLAGDFAWQAPAAESPGAPNAGQDFVGGPTGPADPVINEFVADHSGSDTSEYVEVFGDPSTDYSAYTILEIEGDGAGAGTIDEVVAVGTTDGNGLWVTPFGSNVYENGTLTLLLVTGFTGALGNDIDADNDGTIDNAPWTAIVDDVGVFGDEDPTDTVYSSTVLDEAFDDSRVDSPFGPGGASRFPDGIDTDSAADWYRNDFDVDNSSTQPGEALNTPGAPNEIVPPPAPTVFISELHYDNDGGDVGEFVEVEGDAGTDLSGWSLVLYNGNGGGVYNTVALGGTIDDEDGGRGAVSFAISGIQNGSPDGVALVDGGGNLVEFLSYEGTFTAVGGPADGVESTDIGVSEPGSTPIGQSLQLVNGTWIGPAPASPGDLNGGGTGDPELRRIHEIQGSGDASPLDGQQVIISGIVVGDFQEIVTDDPANDEPLDGFFVQEEDADADDDPATSEGIFVFDPDAIDVAVGDLVEVTGTVDEFFGLTELTSVSDITIVSSGNPIPTPAQPTVPTAVDDTPVAWETIEGMGVSFSQPLYVTGMFPLGSFGEVQLSAIGAQDHPNQLFDPGSTEAVEQRLLNEISRVILEDGEDENESFPNGIPTWNPEPTPFLGGPDDTLRSGDEVVGLSGVVNFAFGEYEVIPVNVADPTDPDGAVTINYFPRPSGVPDVGGELEVAAFNVLNYFVTLDQGSNTCGPPGFEQDCRGADTQAEFDLQSAKIADAIADLDADIVGLIELENSGNDEAIADLVAKVNARSSRTYEFIATGYIGTDAIAVGLIYDPATVTPDGDFAVLDSSVSPAFIDDRNRPALAQTFIDAASNNELTVAVNHLKSKGSPCDDVANPGDPAFGVEPYDVGDDPDVGPLGDPLYTGNCNLTRTAAATVLGQWLASDPTGTGAANTMILGDLNSYPQEDPVTVLEAQGYTNLVASYVGLTWDEGGHTFVFDGEHGSLDYAMTNPRLTAQVTGAAPWHINADEPFAIDYQNFNPPGQAQPDEWKSSDHDPVLVGLALDPFYRCAGVEGTEADLVAAGYNVVFGTDGADRIRGTQGADFILAGGGDDRVQGFGGADVICGGDGDDRIDGGTGDDRLDGAGGDDTVRGGNGDDAVAGGADDDRLWGNGGTDSCDGGPGTGDVADDSCEAVTGVP